MYIVGFLRGGSRREVFPIREGDTKPFRPQGQSVNTTTTRCGENRSPGSFAVENKLLSSKRELRQLVGGAQGQRIYDSGGVSVTLSAHGGGQGAKTGLYAIPILTPDRAANRQMGRRYKEPNDDMFTLTTQDRHGVILQKDIGKNKGEEKETDPTSTSHSEQDNNFLKTHRVRKLTPLECWRLQGFTDEQFYKAKNTGLSDNQLYGQAGNAVTVNVVYEIGKRLIGIEE